MGEASRGVRGTGGCIMAHSVPSARTWHRSNLTGSSGGGKREGLLERREYSRGWGGEADGEGAGGSGHKKVHSRASCGKCQDFAQEGPEEELEWGKSEGLILSRTRPCEPGSAAVCRDRQGVSCVGECRDGIFLVPGIGSGGSLGGGVLGIGRVVLERCKEGRMSLGGKGPRR